jgi:hypothetical protein
MMGNFVKTKPVFFLRLAALFYERSLHFSVGCFGIYQTEFQAKVIIVRFRFILRPFSANRL